MNDELKQISIMRRALAPVIEQMEATLAKRDEQISELFSKVAEAIAKIDVNPTVAVPELNGLIEKLQGLQKADAPNVSYSPQITVPGIQDLADKLNALQNPKPDPVLANYKPHDQDSAANGAARYYGFVNPNGNWYIMRNMTGEQRYAAGVIDYEANWDRRDKLDYTNLGDAM